MGTYNDVLGTVSATIRRKMVKARSTLIPALIFSPAEGGMQKTTSTYERKILYTFIEFLPFNKPFSDIYILNILYEIK